MKSTYLFLLSVLLIIWVGSHFLKWKKINGVQDVLLWMDGQWKMALILNKDGTFTLNEYSWNKAANMLYIGSPGNVGYSYINSGLENDLKMDDDIVAKVNLNALYFYLKFPEYKNRDSYISGESYSGIYIPILAYESNIFIEFIHRAKILTMIINKFLETIFSNDKNFFYLIKIYGLL